MVHARVTRCLWALAVLGWAASWACAGQAQDPNREVRLMLTPAPEPEYALQYRFDTPYPDQRPGNGALLYETAVSLLGAVSDDWNQVRDKIDRWFKAEPDDLPLDEVREIVSRFGPSIHYLDLASRSEHFEWNCPVREDGLRLILPNLSAYRTLVGVLALKARLAMADGAVSEALDTIRIGLCMGRDLGKEPVLVQALLGLAVANRMVLEVERLVQMPDAPNLYWALTSLPVPLVDMRTALEMENAMLFAEIPQFRTIETTVLSEQQLTQIWDKIQSLQDEKEPRAVVAAMTLAGAMRVYPEAKAFLAKQGRTSSQINAMPTLQVVLIYELHRFGHLMDRMHRWNYVAYAEVGDSLTKAEQELFSMASEQGALSDALLNVVPISLRVPFLAARLERDIAMMRCVEAMRIYAAGHQGRLPQSLAAVTEVPIPDDPIHGRGFKYRLDGDKAVLESPAPAGEDGRKGGGVRFEIRIRPKADHDKASH